MIRKKLQSDFDKAELNRSDKVAELENVCKNIHFITLDYNNLLESLCKLKIKELRDQVLLQHYTDLIEKFSPSNKGVFKPLVCGYILDIQRDIEIAKASLQDTTKKILLLDEALKRIKVIMEVYEEVKVNLESEVGLADQQKASKQKILNNFNYLMDNCFCQLALCCGVSTSLMALNLITAPLLIKSASCCVPQVANADFLTILGMTAAPSMSTALLTGALITKALVNDDRVAKANGGVGFLKPPKNVFLLSTGCNLAQLSCVGAMAGAISGPVTTVNIANMALAGAIGSVNCAAASKTALVIQKEIARKKEMARIIIENYSDTAPVSIRIDRSEA